MKGRGGRRRTLHASSTILAIVAAAASVATGTLATASASGPEATRPLAARPLAARPLAATRPQEAWSAPPPAERRATDPGDGVYYEIFVRSFLDSSGDGNGDLRGLRSRLGYLSWLGVSGVWLMPIHPSPTYHGYDVTDYRAIHPDYGTMADFVAFVDEAHARGIRVVLDLVVNHTSSLHPWFQAALSGDERYRERYVWSDERLGWRGTGGGPAWHAAGDGTYYLGLFEAGMPDLNHSNPDVTAALLDVAAFWLDLGVDGFRVDAIQHVVEGEGGVVANAPENYDWVRSFNQELRARRPGAFIVGETWTSTPAIAAYHREAGLDMSFNYPLWRTLLSAVSGRSAIDLRAQLELDDATYPPGARRGTFLANHDQTRPATSLAPLRRDEARLALAAGLLLTLPGTPFLYYGEEIGLPNGPGADDRDKRTPMRWSATGDGGFTAGEPWREPSTLDEAISVAAQRADAGSLLTTYARLIELRRTAPALERGSLRLVPGLPSSLLAFWRERGDERVLIVANLGAGAADLDAGDLGLHGPAGDLLEGGAVQGTFTIPGTSLRVLAPARDRRP